LLHCLRERSQEDAVVEPFTGKVNVQIAYCVI
jgi:hypothetical protein